MARQSIIVAGRPLEDGAPLALDAGTRLVLVMKPDERDCSMELKNAKVQLSIQGAYPEDGTPKLVEAEPDETVAVVKGRLGALLGREAQELVYAGCFLDAARTLRSYNLMPGNFNPLHEMVRLRGSIGVFVQGDSAALAPGAALLTAPAAFLPSPGPAVVAALARVVLAPAGRPPRGNVYVGSAEALAPSARAALAAAADAAWARGENHAADGAFAAECRGAPAAAVAAAVAAGSSRADFKLLLGGATVAAALGEAGVAAVLGALEAVRVPRAGAAPLRLADVTFAVRRTEAQAAAPRWIGFHYDTAGATAQVPLGGAGNVGGRTVFALPSGELLAPERDAGRVVAHHGDVAHGVTAHEAGTRYGLFALVAREDLGSPVAGA